MVSILRWFWLFLVAFGLLLGTASGGYVTPTSHGDGTLILGYGQGKAVVKEGGEQVVKQGVKLGSAIMDATRALPAPSGGVITDVSKMLPWNGSGASSFINSGAETLSLKTKNATEWFYDGWKGGGAAKTIAPAKRTSGSTVLGHYPEYMNMADSLGHRRFDIPKAAWDKMTDAQRWAANQKFLDRTISRGDDILLSTPLDKVKPGSYFERELQYLSGKGYRPSADGTRLVPGGN